MHCRLGGHPERARGITHASFCRRCWRRQSEHILPARRSPDSDWSPVRCQYSAVPMVVSWGLFIVTINKTHLGGCSHPGGLHTLNGLINQSSAVIWVGRESLPVTSSFGYPSDRADHRAQEQVDTFPSEFMTHVGSTLLS